MARYSVESAVVLAVILFIPGAFSQTFAITAQDTGHWIFKQGANTGKEVGALTIIRTGNGSQTFDGTSIVIGGSCSTCLSSSTLEVTSTFNLSAKIFPRGNETWDACKGNLTEISTGAAPGLPYCIAEFQLVSSNMTELGSNLSRNVYINRTPSMTVVPMLSSIPQNALLDTKVFQVSTNDQDNLPRTISIDSCTPATPCPFSLRSSNGSSCIDSPSCTFTSAGEAPYDIVLGRTLVNSTAATLSIRLKLVDGISLNNPNQQHTLYEEHKIAVLRPPVFTERPGVAEVNENDTEGTIIMTVKAIDRDDHKPPSEVTYSVCELETFNATSCSSTSARVRIEKIQATGQGKVLLNTPNQLSSLVGNFFFIRITANIATNNATEVNMLSLSTDLSLRILVNDVNNNPPVFQSLNSVGEGPGQVITGFKASIRENAIAGTVVEFADQSVICISDLLDLGANAQFRLSVIGPSQNTFEAYPTNVIQGIAFLTVRVKNNTALDTETLSIMEVKIRATSTEPAVGSEVLEFWVSELVLQVTIVDLNDNPTFYEPMVDGNCGNSSSVLTVRETIFSGTRVPVFEMGSHVRDSDFELINRNDVQFYLKDPTQARQFNLSAQGKLEVISALDYEKVRLHHISIGIDNIGRDGVMQTSQCSFQLAVDDVNDELPQFTGPPALTFSVDENWTGSIPQGIFTATDADATANLTFSITLDRAFGPDGLQFANFALLDHITISTQLPSPPAFPFWRGRLTVRRSLDRETVATILAVVTVTDQAAEEPLLQTVTTTISITVNDLNDNPPDVRFNGQAISHLGNVTVNVTERTRQEVHLDFYASDKDSVPKTPPFFHEILNLDPTYQNHIGVETKDNGLICVKTLLPFEYRLIQSLTFQLVIRDAKEGFAMQTTVDVTLVIIDVNNFLPRITVPRNYDPSNTSSVWEYLETDIRATFIPLAFLTVEAEDDDSDEFMPLNYFLSYDEAPQLEGYVKINITTGVVSVVRPLDREAPGMADLMMLTIRVMDNANRGYNQQTSVGTRIAFRVTDRNDNPPILHFNNIVLDKGAAISQQIPEYHDGTVNIDFHATDADSTPSTPPFYTILTVVPVGYRTHFDTFSDRTGLVRLLILKKFDYCLVQNLIITLTVYDSDPNAPFNPILNTAVTVRLEILDTNNLFPRVSYPINYDPASPSAELFSAMETDSRNTNQFTAFPVLTVNAVDDDSDQFLPFDYFLSFKLAPCLQGFMEIDRSTGVVSVVKPLDREETGMNETLIVEVFVMDNAKQGFNQLNSSVSKFALKISDVNDNPPKFSSPENGYSVAVLEKNNKAGWKLPFKNHQATDSDLPDGCGKIFYSVNPADGPVSVDTTTADITLKEALTADVQFMLIADDGTMPGCSIGRSSVTVPMTIKFLAEGQLYTITVDLEKNDNTNRREALEKIDRLLTAIADEKGFDYGFHGVEEVTSRAATPHVITFAFLNRTTKEALAKEKISGIIVEHATELRAVGVINDGTARPPEESSDGYIVAVVILTLLAVTFLCAATFLYVKTQPSMNRPVVDLARWKDFWRPKPRRPTPDRPRHPVNVIEDPVNVMEEELPPVPPNPMPQQPQPQGPVTIFGGDVNALILKTEFPQQYNYDLDEIVNDPVSDSPVNSDYEAD
ncbi:hypothetical protein BV898_05434 [Hypsibius exemplaris]|uniref:Cadherin domain-containing protein n=1 Tax=Hypsibius exemplaris TaxID=2072580 RepID=A0A1W0WZM3_HYPEX|nr:hypothetical protein BV898_05434 [Hypsibius exemplaris]